MSTTIKLNVGGTIYQVSKSLLEKFPGSLLERCASKTWNEGGEEVFIEGDKTRFRQVLDYMRHGEVTLPKGESTPSFLKELEYYGIEYDKDKIMNIDDLCIHSFIPFSQSIREDKNSKIYKYVVAVITSDIIDASFTMITLAKSSVEVHYNTAPTFAKDEKDLDLAEKERIMVASYLSNLHKHNIEGELLDAANKNIVDRINPNISKASLKISKSCISADNSWFRVSSLSEE